MSKEINKEINNAIDLVFSRIPEKPEFTKLICNVNDIIAVLYKYKSTELRVVLISLTKNKNNYFDYEVWFDLSEIYDYYNNNDKYNKVYKEIIDSGITNLL